MKTIYYNNARSPALQSIERQKPGAWIHVAQPTNQELEDLADELNLETDLLLDANDMYESPRVEQEGKSVYVFARYCYPEGKELATEPLLLIYTPDYLVTILRNDTSVLGSLTSGKAQLITTQRTKAFLQVLETVNNSYKRHIQKVGKQILSIRGQLRKTTINNQVFVDFIDIEEDLNEIHSALQAQAVVLRNLLNGKYFKLYDDDKDLIEDLSLGTGELLELTRARLVTISTTREAYATIMANTLNKTFKKLTSISIFMTIPTITTGLYGMNLALPLSRNPHAFWFILLLVMSVTLAAIALFKKLRWL